MKSSQEFGKYDGLGLINGDVISLERNESYPIPHIGWSQIQVEKNKTENKLF